LVQLRLHPARAAVMSVWFGNGSILRRLLVLTPARRVPVAAGLRRITPFRPVRDCFRCRRLQHRAAAPEGAAKHQRSHQRQPNWKVDAGHPFIETRLLFDKSQCISEGAFRRSATGLTIYPLGVYDVLSIILIIGEPRDAQESQARPEHGM
ncbi:MAG TPA: hypothetical protein PKC18_15815, partial [Lacipirellulaceae bacterium]|nr:hypothetical protein [Lacipirellulaceae bacterium]